METKSVLRQLISAGMWVSGGVLLGRLAGFVREVAIASRFGVSEQADVVIFALTLPDFLINILMGGALAAALIPQFKHHTQKEMNGLFLQSSALVGLGFLLLALGLIAGANTVVDLFAPGFDSEASLSAASLLTIVLWLLPLTALAGITTAYLQAQGHFAVPALGTLIFNLTLIVALWGFMDGPDGLILFAGAMIVGGLLRWASQLLCLPKYGLTKGIASGWHIDKSLLLRYLQALGAGSLLLFFPVIARALASLQGTGGFASLNYATKLVELPMGVCLGVFASVLLPKMADYFAQEDREEEGIQLARNGVLWIFIISYNLILVFAWYGEELTRLVFGWGEMSGRGTGNIAVLAAIGMIVLPAQGTATLLAAAANARRDTALPLKSSLLGLAVFVPLAWLGERGWGLPGIMTALVIAYWAVMAYQIVLLSKRHGLQIVDAELAGDAARVAVAGLLLIVPFALATWALQPGLAGQVVFAVLAAGTMLAGGCLIVPRYREFLINQWRAYFTA